MSAIQQLITEHMDIWTAADTTKRSGRGRASGNAGSIYGVKKLRELILELAVRGKLVPQDANDEPASELLKRIQAEKAKLISESKIKKDKPLAPIGEDEKPFDLPQSWEWTRLQEVYDVRDGTHDTPKYQDSGFPLVTSKNLYSGTLDFSDIKYISKDDHLKIKDRSGVDKGDILFAMIGSIGNPVIVDTDIEFSIKNVALFKPYSGQLSDTSYLLKYLIMAAINLREEAAGAVQSFVSLGVIRSYLMPIPPLAEQHRIVAKVDELMALCDQLEAQHSNAAEAHEKLVSHLLGMLTQSQSTDDFNANWQRIAAHFDTLFTTEASIDALKQTLLQLAVMGKLVPQNTNDEPASELLKRITAEKAKLIAEGKIKKDKTLAPIGEDDKPFELPQGWEWVKLGVITQKLTDGSHNPPSDAGSGLPMLSSQNVNLGKIDFNSPSRFVTEEDFIIENSRTKIEANDVLLTIVGSLGRSAVVPANAPKFVLQRSVAVIKTELFSEFLCLQLSSPYCANYFDLHGKGTAQKGIYLGQLSEMPTVVPSIAEQHRIVAKVDELMALCDQLKTRIQQANQQQQAIANVLVAQVLK